MFDIAGQAVAASEMEGNDVKGPLVKVNLGICLFASAFSYSL